MSLKYYAKVEQAIRKIKYVADILAESYGDREDSLVRNLDEAIELLKEE